MFIIICITFLLKNDRFILFVVAHSLVGFTAPEILNKANLSV